MLKVSQFPPKNVQQCNNNIMQIYHGRHTLPLSAMAVVGENIMSLRMENLA